MDGQAFKPLGIRAASATYDQATTDKLLDALDSYELVGMNTASVFFQGSSGGNYRCFTADGTSIDSGHLSRMEQIAAEFRSRRMCLILGIYYQNAPFLNDPAAYEAATRLVAQEFAGYPNVIVNIANENNSATWASCPVDFRTAENVLDHCAFVTEEAPGLLVGGGGGYLVSSSQTIGLDARCKVLLYDTVDTGTSGADYDTFRAAGITKPIINVETFGGSTKDIHATRGVYTDAWFKQTPTKGHYIRDLDEVIARNMGLLFHDNRWTQPLSGGAIGSGFTEADIRYDLAGQGTSGSPGISWWPEYYQANS